MRKATEQQSLSAVAGAGGQRTLTSVDSPFTYAGLITGARTTDSGILLNADQYAEDNNSEATPFVNRPFRNDGVYDATWSVNNTITIPAGTITIYLG